MRLWYQYPAPVMGIRGAVFELLETIFNRVKRPGTSIEIRTPARGGRASLWPYETFKMFAAREIFDSVVRAEAEGFDGVLIGQSAEPVLTEAKETLTIPVTGISESGFHLANQLGARFGLVTIPTPPGIPRGKVVQPILRNVRRYGLDDHFVGWNEIPMPYGEFNAAISGGDRRIAQQAFLEAARPLVDQGAEVIVPSETLISVVLAVDGLIEVPGTGAAVVDIIAAGVKNLEMLVDLRRTTGLLRGRSLTYFRMPDEDLAITRQAFGVDPI